MMNLRSLVKPLLVLSLILVGLGAGAYWWWEARRARAASEDRFIQLRELPGVSADVLAAQGQIYRVAEPFLYHPVTRTAEFSVEILSRRNFGAQTHVWFGGDAESLQSLANEIRLVNAGPARAGSAAEGVGDGVKGLTEGLWYLIRHPIDTATKLGGAAIDLAVYVKDTPAAQMQSDVAEVASAYYVNQAVETAEARGVNYFELKTGAGQKAVESETNFRIGGEAAFEVATILVPFAKVKYAGEAAKVAEAGALAGKLAEQGVIGREAGRLTRAVQFFPKATAKMAATAKRLQHAMPPLNVAPPIARFGNATDFNYRQTFFTKYPELKGLMVVHHAVEKQVLTMYPGVISPAKLHSLENLRGIPRYLDDKLHKSILRKEWDEFYEANPPGSGKMTEKLLLDKATELDRKYGQHFRPRLI